MRFATLFMNMRYLHIMRKLKHIQTLLIGEDTLYLNMWKGEKESQSKHVGKDVESECI